MNAKRAGAMAKIGKRATTNLLGEKQYRSFVQPKPLCPSKGLRMCFRF